MVICMATSAVPQQFKQNDKKTSRGNNNKDVLDRNVQKTEKEYNCDQSTMADIGHKMMSGDDDIGAFARPRSFSDASLSHGRPGVTGAYLRNIPDDKDGKRHDEPVKTAVKFYVCRESEIVKGPDRGRKVASGNADIRRASLAGSHVPVSRSKSAVGRPGSGIKGVGAPLKPKLPDNYRQYFSQQIYNKQRGEITKPSDRKTVVESQSANVIDSKNNFEHERERTELENEKNAVRLGGRNEKFKVLSVTSGKHAGEPKTEGCKLRHASSSDSDILSHNSIVYRHLDSKFQSDLLKKELEKLRTSEHVRKNSETVQRRLSSETSPKSTDDLHVRFSDDFSRKNQGSVNRYDKHVDNVIDLNVKTGAIVKKPLKQSMSSDLEKQRPKVNPKHQKVSRQGHGYRLQRNPIPLQPGALPPSGALRGTDLKNVGGTLGDHQKNIAQSNHGDSKSQEPRRMSQNRGQSQQGRSKSESNLNRNTEKVRLLDENTSSKTSRQNKNETPRSTSPSNLRRKQDTIRKFNASTAEQKREKIRQNYYKSHDNLGSREESLSSDSEGDNHHGNDKSKQESDRIYQHGKVKKDGKTVADNRSDEEKYAALSRNKILHSKSSSLDSQLKDDETPRNVRNNLQTSDRMKLVFNNSNTGANIKRFLEESKVLQKDSYSSSDSLEKFYLLENKGVKTEKFNTDLQFSDRECIPKKGAKQTDNALKTEDVGSSGNRKIVLRQCRVGEDVVFGLVGVRESKHTKQKPNGNGYLDGQGLVTIRMIPDEQGRFGFNVKGGADQGMPIIVSRVAPNTPADNAIPRLNEGDQVLFINGRDVSQHTHEQVVLFIRHSRETRSKELVLIVRPNAYSGDDNADEPDFVYDTESNQIKITSANGGGNSLDMSLKLLEESLESGAALAQFEQLYRKKPGMTMNSARLEINVPKNRYRDISPYDQTRVIMKNGANGDYINANYVNMEIPVSGIVNRYIAAQGPLPTTCIDFWQMIWEQQSTLVVMLTTKVERGRIKCHQYWPDLYETSDYGHLQITCVKEEETSSFAFREFNLTHVESQEERHISHMQYIAWPDHGVPDDPADFLEFVIKVRQKRVGLVEPSIVHCSAGIGRTGVLITMETAMCLIEANQGVYPLSIVRQMRDQRAMLIQTPNQYKFVCEAILRCFNESIVKPLPEYQQR